MQVAKGGQVAKSEMQQPNTGIAQGQDQGLIKVEPLYKLQFVVASHSYFYPSATCTVKLVFFLPPSI